MLKLVALGGAALAYIWMSPRPFSIIEAATALFGVYVASGGYKTMWLAYKTLPRDLRVGFRYLKVVLKIKGCLRNNKTVIDLFRENVRKHPNKAAFLFEDQKWTFAEVDEYSNRVANYFLNLHDLNRGDAVALFMENRPQYVCTWLGLAKAGLVPALINFNLRHAPLIHSITTAGCKAVIYGSEVSSAIGDIKKELGPDMKFFCSGPVPEDTSITGDRLEKYLDGASACPPVLKEKIKTTDKLVYIYTSGTTGMPKAAVIRHSRYEMIASGTFYALGFHWNDIVYDPLPLYHTAGGAIGVGLGIVYGLTIVLRQKFSVTNYWKDIVKHKCTVAQYIGEICRYLLSSPPKPEDTQHQVRVMFGNGVRPQIWQEFVDRFHVPRICEFYGATEGNANIVNIEGKVGAVGFVSVLFPWIYPVGLIRIDENTGDPLRGKNGVCIRCKPGEPGEFVGKIIRNDPVRDFHGYADKKASEKKIITDVFRKGDAAFRSGDILVMDEFGYLYFKDRMGDTFRWKGENVSTTEVEGIVSNIASLSDSVVYGVEIPKMEGRVGMAAVHDPEGSLNLEKLAQGICDQLPSYARPAFLRVVKELDITGTYKLKKLDLQKQGYEVSKIKDPLYFFDVKKQNFVPMDEELYTNIVEGKTRL